MKYTFTTENGSEKTITIPDEFIARTRAAYGVTHREAIEMYLSDEGYIVNYDVEQLTEKAKNVRNVVQSGKKRKVTRKPDEVKRALIVLLEDSLKDNADGPYPIENIQVTNIERIIAFSIGDDNYEITLSKKRKPKQN